MLMAFFRVLRWQVGGPKAADELVYDIPSIGQFALTIVGHVLCTEIWFYWIHRSLHFNKWLHRKVHSIHHKYKAPSCLESVYVHPVEFLLNSFPVLLVGALVTGAHLVTLWMWLWMATFLQVHDHSGYWLPFLPRVLMHDYHHQNVDFCFGILGLMDAIFGTEGGFQEFVRKHEHTSVPEIGSPPTAKTK